MSFHRAVGPDILRSSSILVSMREIKFKASKYHPRWSDRRWLKKQLRKIPKGAWIEFTIIFTEDSLYKVRDVGSGPDQDDWFKIGGTKPIIGAIAHGLDPYFPKLERFAREELGALRHNTKGQLQVANYERSDRSNGDHYVTNIKNTEIGKPITLLVRKKYAALMVAAYAGGDGRTTTAWSFELGIRWIRTD